MSKRDIKRELRSLYHASSKHVAEVDVPPFSYLMIDGQGDPNTSAAYAQAVACLFSVSYTAKFALKKSALAIDYTVMPLEGLWWADDWSVFSANDRTRWKWTMMILQPDFVPVKIIHDAIKRVGETKHLPGLEKLRLERLQEGPSAQLLHVGPFSEEGPTIARLHEHIDGKSARAGKHHEIYLSDIRRAAPSKWKTILRQPMQPSKTAG
ncbi:MAG: GyrI-like domain-containing protein [Burkholderiales bacterium]|nr:GyrI-like domain-containing protein [Opitutaceae bacterium]